MAIDEAFITKLDEKFPGMRARMQSVPELWNILIWATEAGFSPVRLQAAIENSAYYKNTSTAQRNWQVLSATDPAQARREQEKAQEKTLRASARLGANFTQAQIGYVSQQAVANGWSDQELNDAVLGYVHKNLKHGQRGVGQFTAAMSEVRKIANEYAVPVSNKEAAGMASELLRGPSGTVAGTAEGVRDRFKRQAMSLFPTLREELAAGVTVQEWSQPYRALAAQELGVSAEAITFNDPKWKAMLEGQGNTSKPGKQPTYKPMSLAEWQTKIRTDQRYGFDKTTNGRLAATGLADEVLTMLGKRG